MDNEHEPAQTPPVDSSPETPPAPAPEPEPTPEPEPDHTTAPAPAAPPSLLRETGPAFYVVVAVLLFVVSYSIAFIVGNHRKIHVDFVFAETDVSLIWTILLLLAVGFVGGVLLSQLYRHQRLHRRKRRKQSSKA